MFENCPVLWFPAGVPALVDVKLEASGILSECQTHTRARMYEDAPTEP